MYYNTTYDGYSDKKAAFFGVTSTSNLTGYDFRLKAESRVSGTVRASGGAALENASVDIWARDGGNISHGYPDAAGKYTAGNLFAPGTYVARASADGYATSFYDGAFDWETATDLVLTDTITTTGINFILTPEARISGKVTLANGTPVNQACVHAQSQVFSTIVTAETNTSGYYLLTNLPVGEIYIQVEPDCYNRNPGLSNRYYTSSGGASSSSEAEALTTTAGGTISDINITVYSGGSISGYVKKSDGSLISDVSIYVSAGEKDALVSPTDGKYTISGLAPGSYRVNANAREEPGYEHKYYNNAHRYDDATLVTVTAGSTTSGIDFNLASAGSISGYVRRASDHAALSNVWVYAMNSDHDFLSGDYTGADGSYTIGSIPTGGAYVFARPEGYGGVYYPNSYDDPGAALVQVTAPANTPGINFEVSPEGTIQGVVYRADGTPLKGANVSVSPFNGGQIFSGVTGEDGSYMLGGLAAGRYVVRAEVGGLMTTYYQNATHWDMATPVTVQTGTATTGIDVTLINAGAVTGVIKKTDGSVITDKEIRVAATGISPGTNSIWNYVSSLDGSFQIQGLIPGTYRLRINYIRQMPYEFKYYPNAAGVNEAQLITVNPGQTTVLNPVTLGYGGSISGTIWKPDGTAANAACALLSLTAPAVDSWGKWCADANNTFFLNSIPPGQYYLKTLTYTDDLAEYQNVWYSSSGSTTDGTRAEAITVTAGSSTTNIRLTLAEQGAAIKGTITTDFGEILNGNRFTMYVQAYNADSGAAVENSFVLENGTYIIGGLAPGRYRVLANSTPNSGFVSKYYDNRYLQGEAVILELSAGETLEGINFNLPRTASETVYSGQAATLTYTPPENPAAPVTTVQIPAEAVTQETILVYSPVDQIDAPYGFNFAGQAFAINAYQGYTLTPGLTFAVPATFTLHYDETAVADEDNLILNYWNKNTEAWEDAACGAYDRHPAENWLSVPICHLSEFALFEERFMEYLPLVGR